MDGYAYRRRRDDAGVNGLVNSLPPWLKALLALGVVPAIAVFLVYFVTQRVDARLEKIDNTTIATYGEAKSANEHAQEVEKAFDKLQRSLDRICVNTANTERQRDACLKP